MDIPIGQIFAIVRKPGDPVFAFNALRALGEAQLPSPVWQALPTPDVEADVEVAERWLFDEINAYQPTGVYLGLDTLNEREGRGENVEIGMTRNADPNKLTLDWAWQCEKYGKSHLIRGVYETHDKYTSSELNERSQLLADYLFFFGYSAVVLASAIERLPMVRDRLFIWGFHDDSLALLTKGTGSGANRVCVYETA